MSKFTYDNKFRIKSTNVHGVLRTIEDPDRFEGTEVRIDFFGAWDSNERKSIIKFNAPISNTPTSFHIISDFNSITSVSILFENREKAQAYVDELKQYASDHHNVDLIFLDFLPRPCQLYHDPCEDAATVIKPNSTILFYNKNTYHDTEEDLIKKLGIKDKRIIHNLHSYIMYKEEGIIWDEEIGLRIHVMPQVRIIVCVNDKDNSCIEYAYNIVEH